MKLQQIILNTMVLSACGLQVLNSLLRRITWSIFLHSLPTSLYNLTAISRKMIILARQKAQQTLCLSVGITQTVLEIPQQTRLGVIRRCCSTGSWSTQTARLSRIPARRAANSFCKLCSCVNTWSSMQVPMMKIAWSSSTHAVSVSDIFYSLMTFTAISLVTATTGHILAWYVHGHSNVRMTLRSTWRHMEMSGRIPAGSAQNSWKVPVSSGSTCARFTENGLSARTAVCSFALAVSSVDTSVNSMQVCALRTTRLLIPRILWDRRFFVWSLVAALMKQQLSVQTVKTLVMMIIIILMAITSFFCH